MTKKMMILNLISSLIIDKNSVCYMILYASSLYNISLYDGLLVSFVICNFQYASKLLLLNIIYVHELIVLLMYLNIIMRYFSA